jgi:hypothetical protein
MGARRLKTAAMKMHPRRPTSSLTGSESHAVLRRFVSVSSGLATEMKEMMDSQERNGNVRH